LASFKLPSPSARLVSLNAERHQEPDEKDDHRADRDAYHDSHYFHEPGRRLVRRVDLPSEVAADPSTQGEYTGTGECAGPEVFGVANGTRPHALGELRRRGSLKFARPQSRKQPSAHRFGSFPQLESGCRPLDRGGGESLRPLAPSFPAMLASCDHG
jgi:hypothetical protein